MHNQEVTAFASLCAEHKVSFGLRQSKPTVEKELIHVLV